MHLAAQADGLLNRPLRQREQDLRSLLVVGLYQLRPLRIPAHAAVAEFARDIWQGGRRA